MKRPEIRVSRNEIRANIPPRPDFDILAKRVAAQQHSGFHWKWGAASVGFAGALLLFYWFGIHKNNVQKLLPKKEALSTEQSAVKPPVPSWDIKYDTFNVNVEHGDTIKYKGCTEIIIPASGITKNNGELVKETQVLYREFQNQAEIMASGIPMVYDSANQKMLFESAGMFELRSAHSDEKINASTGIDVRMCSQHSQAGFNWYKLDEKTGKWSYIQPVKTPKIAPKNDSATAQPKIPSNSELPAMEMIAVQKNNVQSVGVQQPIKPKMKSAKGYTITVDVPQLPELAVYQNVEFEVLPGQGYDPDAISDLWDYITVKPTSKHGEYVVSLFDKNQSLKYRAIPVFTNESDYNQALKVFKEKENNYFKELAAENKRQEELAKAEAEKAKRDMVILKNEQRRLQNDAANANQDRANGWAGTKDFIPQNDLNYSGMVVSMNINNFGYFNSDRPIRNTNQNISIKYTIDNGGQPDGILYQFYLNRNAVMANYCFKPEQVNLRYQSNDQCILLAILPAEKRIAILSNEEFQQEVKARKNTTIVLNKLDRVFNSSAEIQDYVKRNYNMELKQ
ncbi:MAG: hypothetical protein IT244_08615 [Bacteroidia bacterium]|nr:hypothetical protein [Bacteroidia bacterium]